MFNYILYRIGQFIALNLPLKFAYRVATFISDLRFLYAGKDRRTVIGNLKAIFPEKSDKEIERLSRKMFRNFAKYLVDFFRFEKLNLEYIHKNICLEGMYNFEDALAKNKGVIVLTAHLGNWELGGVVIALLGYPFWAVALPHKDKKVDKFFNFQRERKGVKVIPLGRAVRTSLALLRENKMVALVGDRDFTEKGQVVEFFGRPTSFPEGPAAFSLQTQAIIVPGFMTRNKDDSFTLKIEKPIDFAPSGNKKEDMQKLIVTYKNTIEDYIKQYPDQWYMFRRFWIS